jgi:DNA-binding transcriptional ArsR family regulator
VSDLSAVLGAISHPSRRAMLARLARGPARVTEIAEPFAMSLNAVSKHIKVLEGAGLLRRQKQGRDHVLEFRAESLRQVAGWVHEYERFWNERLDEFQGYFEEKKKGKERKR